MTQQRSKRVLSSFLVSLAAGWDSGKIDGFRCTHTVSWNKWEEEKQEGGTCGYR